MGYENGYKEMYFPKEDGIALEHFNKGESVTIKAVPIKEISYKHETAYGVYNCEEIVDDGEIPGTFKICGSFVTPVDCGQTYEIKGKIDVYGGKKQIKVVEMKKVAPSNKRGIISFLESLNGMGFYAEIIYEAYGDKSLDVIRDSPKDILSIAPALYDEIVLGWQKEIGEIKDTHHIVAELMGYGLKAIQIKQLFDRYGEGVVYKIKENPFFLASEVRNYSFKKCDNIAKAIGFPPDHQIRTCEGVFYVINEAQFEGHTYLPMNVLIPRVCDELSIKIGINEAKRLYKQNQYGEYAQFKYGNIVFSIPIMELYQSISDYKNSYSKRAKEESKIIVFKPTREMIDEALNFLATSKRIVIDDDKVYEKSAYDREEQLAYKISNMCANKSPLKLNVEKYLDQYLNKRGISLEEKQREAVLSICSCLGGVFVIDGSAGCGKTFCLKIALDILRAVYMQSIGQFLPITVAPTGKAAQVAAKVTQLDAMTIHRILKYNPTMGYAHNASNPIYYHVLIIDESSMLDVHLAGALFDAINSDAKVIFVGDTKQLPSIGAGNVLRDIISSGAVNVTTLNVVKRQGVDSGIIKNANRIIYGDMITSEKESQDAFVYRSEDQVKCAEKIIALVMKRMAQGIAIDDIQVLCPQKTGVIGVNYMNFLLQERINVSKQQFRILNKQVSINIDDKPYSVDLFFKIGDKVIHTRNNYNAQWYCLDSNQIKEAEGTGVANGECGRIIHMQGGKDALGNRTNSIFVKYDEKIIRYDDDFSELDHAYAMTIHKSQGSQWDTVIMPVMRVNYNMLDRELFYTGWTRAQKMAIAIGEASAMEHAITTMKSNKRYTGLNKKLSLFSSKP